MPAMTEHDVLIVGAGPVGLTLALDLAWRGIEVTVVETRARAAPPEPKCNHVAARTMEIFRRLGLAEEVRNSGLPADYPHDISYRTSFTGTELTRIEIPCRRDRFTRKDGPGLRLADAGAAASHQPDLSRTDPVRTCGGASPHPHHQPHVGRGRQDRGCFRRCGLARSRHRRRPSRELPLSDRLRRRALHRAQGHRRRTERRRRGAARAIDLYSCARPDRPPATRTRLGHRRHQSPPRRHGLCDRRPRMLAGA